MRVEKVRSGNQFRHKLLLKVIRVMSGAGALGLDRG